MYADKWRGPVVRSREGVRVHRGARYSDLRERGEARPGTILISGTISMLKGVNQFADTWKVAMSDPATKDVISVEYRTVPMPEPIG